MYRVIGDRLICWKLCIWRETEGKDREESEETVDMLSLIHI